MADPVTDNADFAVDELKRKARRRLVGAIVLALAAATLLPLLLEQEQKPLGDDVSVQIPPIDGSKFVTGLNDDKGTDAAPDAKADAGSIRSTPDKAPAASPAAPVPSAASPPPAAVPGPPAAEGGERPAPAAKADAKAAAPGAKHAAPTATTADAAVKPAGKPETKGAAKSAAPAAPAAAPAATATPAAAATATATATPAATPAAPANPALTSSATLMAEAPAASTASVAAPAGATPAAASAPPSPKGDGYVVQLGAFTDNYGANALAGKLKKAGYTAYTEPVETSRGTLWRVRVGGYATRQAAVEARNKLKADGQNGVVTAAK